MARKEGNEPLSTADFAKVDDVRGGVREDMRGRADVLDRPAADRKEHDARPLEADSRAPAADKTQPAPPRRQNASLFPEREIDDLRRRWMDAQTAFVDEPRRAVEQADSLVAEVMKHLAEVFANERATLEHQWDRGDNVTTEDLRVALQKYRTFFDRLLSV